MEFPTDVNFRHMKLRAKDRSRKYETQQKVQECFGFFSFIFRFTTSKVRLEEEAVLS